MLRGVTSVTSRNVNASSDPSQRGYWDEFWVRSLCSVCNVHLEGKCPTSCLYPFLYLAACLNHHSSITAVTEWAFLLGWLSVGGWDIYSLKKKTGQKEKIQKLSPPPRGTAGWWTGLFNSVKSAQNVLTPPHWLSWQKTHGGILLEAGTAPECLAITLPLIKMILTSAFNQLL